VAALKCTANCWEPAIAVDAQGRIFVTLAQEPGLAVSTDGGMTYTDVGKPPLPAGAPANLQPGDSMVQTSPDGRLFYYAFLAEPTGLLLPAPVGLQVAVSLDAGRTWSNNVFLSGLNGPGTPVVSPWKSWLGFAPDGTVYLDYNSRGTGLWSARSDDGGATWRHFTKVSPPEDRIISVFMGPPVVDSKGRLYIPYFSDQSPNTDNPFLPQGHVLRVAESDDKGATFTQHVVTTTAAPDWVGAFFPVLAGFAGDIDEFHLAQWSPKDGGTVQVWDNPCHDCLDQPWMDFGSFGKGVATAPWAVVNGNGDFFLCYYASADIECHHGQNHAVLAHDVSGGGDFIHFAVDAHDRVVAPVPDATAHVLSVVTGPSWPTACRPGPRPTPNTCPVT
jgi:hypothetical protein